MDGKFSKFVYHFVRCEHDFRAISQDETIYSNPNAFYPQRFLNPDGTLNNDKVDYAFGYGRRCVLFNGYIPLFPAHFSHRSCPGKFMAGDVVSRPFRDVIFIDIWFNSCG